MACFRCDNNNIVHSVVDGEHLRVDSPRKPAPRIAGRVTRSVWVFFRDDNQLAGALLQVQISDNRPHVHQRHHLHSPGRAVPALSQNSHLCTIAAHFAARTSEALRILPAVHCALHLPGYHFVGAWHTAGLVLGQLYRIDDGMEDVHGIYGAFRAGGVFKQLHAACVSVRLQF